MIIRCSESPHDCVPCCDFCAHVKHDSWFENGKLVTGGPVGCNLHLDKEHQDIAEWCGYCDDFCCFRADKSTGHWYEGWHGFQ